MKKLLGKEVEVYIKFDDIISGILFDSDDDCVYIQSDIDALVAVPKENIKYYTSSSKTVPATNKIENVENVNPGAIEVYIDQTHIINIPVPPTFNLAEFNDNIMKVVLGNPDVQSALTGKVQKSIEYFPGTIYITTDRLTNQTLEKYEEYRQNSGQNSFGISHAGSPITSYVNPSQMVSRLNKLTKRPEEEKNNG